MKLNFCPDGKHCGMIAWVLAQCMRMLCFFKNYNETFVSSSIYGWGTCLGIDNGRNVNIEDATQQKEWIRCN